MSSWKSFLSKFQRVFVQGLEATGELALSAFGFFMFLLAYPVFLVLSPLILSVDAFYSRRFVSSLHPLVRQLGDSEPEKRRLAFEQLMAMGKEAIPLFISVINPMGCRNWDAFSAQLLAIKGLAQLKAKEAFEHLIEILVDWDFNSPEIRAMAAWALGEIGDERAVPHLIEALDDEETVAPEPNDLTFFRSNSIDIFSDAPKPIKHYAAEALKKLGLSELVNALWSVLEEKDDEAIRKLKQFESYRDAIVEVLLSALDNRSLNLSLQAIWALRELKAVEAIPQLERKARSMFTPKIVKEAYREALKDLKFWA
ncbi:MAG: HEAT repeat domain-containing protein [Armatimonadetes bacterium]|nr:HEAT repeat domain-containing protein [Armatimonadota bacterium]MDW8027648.1 HEAT repeat domain-containing protein [Armatimonadota bacterium]